MKYKFVYDNSESTYAILLPKLTFSYCNEFEGIAHTTYSGSIDNNNIIEELINDLTPVIITKKNAIILNLLVNPFFDQLCDYLSENPNISRYKINLIKKHIFSYLGDDFTYKLHLSLAHLPVDGANIYDEKNMYERSKKMLEVLNGRNKKSKKKK